MSAKDLLSAEKAYLAQLLEAIERCVYFLDATTKKLPFPLQGDELEKHKKDVSLFESLSSFNERFSKLQDTLLLQCAMLIYCLVRKMSIF